MKRLRKQVICVFWDATSIRLFFDANCVGRVCCCCVRFSFDDRLIPTLQLTELFIENAGVSCPEKQSSSVCDAENNAGHQGLCNQ